MFVLETKKLSKTFNTSNEKHNVLQDIDFQLEAGKSALLLGNSGCGKSTFLQIVGLLQEATSGEIFIDGQDCSNLNEAKRNKILINKIGFVYQFHYLFNDFTAIENLIIPQLTVGVKYKIAKKKAEEMLKKLNLSSRANAMPNELSGGERQRIAIARAIIKNPRLILADEPTGNLDDEMSDKVINEMLEMVKNQGISLLVVTHNRSFIEKFDVAYEIHNKNITQIK